MVLLRGDIILSDGGTMKTAGEALPVGDDGDAVGSTGDGDDGADAVRGGDVATEDDGGRKDGRLSETAAGLTELGEDEHVADNTDEVERAGERINTGWLAEEEDKLGGEGDRERPGTGEGEGDEVGDSDGEIEVITAVLD
jgi:hypothetical protein